jgi:catechol 2,3-dioxygenase-like lactoylglutathione lyase family enzyme
MPNVSHFSINADDVSRARRFYERAFGWKFSAWGPPKFYMIDTHAEGEAAGIHGSLQGRRERQLAQQGAACIERPRRHVAAIEPQDVAPAIAVEVGGSGNRPVWGDRADTPGLQDREPIEQPHRGVAAGVAPQQVGLAVAVEVALPDD